MAARPAQAALRQYVDDELLRAPLLFDQILENAITYARKQLPMMPPLQRSTFGELMQALLAQRSRLSDYFVRSLTADEIVSQPVHALSLYVGALRQEGKEYVVSDGDVLNFKFNV